MKTYLYPIFILILGLMNCDKIENPYEQIEGGFNASVCQDSITFGPNTNTVRNILVEEFTGHKCGNCPSGAYDLKQYKQNYGEQLIIIAVHSGSFAETESGTGKFFTDYTTSEGNKITEDFQIQFYPTALINRSDSAYGNSNKVVFQQNWNTAINNFTSSLPLVNIQNITNYDENSKVLCIYTETEVLSNLTGDYNLVIAITEDSIIDWQKNYAVPAGSPEYPAADIEEYPHAHVLRDHVNGTYGEVLISGGASLGDKINTKHSMTLPNNWNAAHLHVVTYVFDASSKEIIQVIESEI